MRHKIFAAILCGVILLNLTGCGKKQNTAEKETNNPAPIQTEEKSDMLPKDTGSSDEQKTPEPDISDANESKTPEIPQETPSPRPEEKKPEPEPQEKPKPVQSPESESPQTPTPPVNRPDTPQDIPYVRPDADEVARKTAEYINRLRAEQGSTVVTILPGLTEVAKFRSQQLITNFAHDTEDERKALAKYKYGEFVDMTELGYDASYSYYTYNGGEAIAKGNWTGTADEIAWKIANGFKNSKGHWAYVGSSEYEYMAVGITFNPSDLHWYCCVCMSGTNYG